MTEPTAAQAAEAYWQIKLDLHHAEREDQALREALEYASAKWDEAMEREAKR